MAQPRYTTLMHSTVKRFFKVVASKARPDAAHQQATRLESTGARAKTGAHVQFSPLAPFFVFGRIAPFA